MHHTTKNISITPKHNPLVSTNPIIHVNTSNALMTSQYRSEESISALCPVTLALICRAEMSQCTFIPGLRGILHRKRSSNVLYIRLWMSMAWMAITSDKLLWGSTIQLYQGSTSWTKFKLCFEYLQLFGLSLPDRFLNLRVYSEKRYLKDLKLRSMQHCTCRYL